MPLGAILGIASRFGWKGILVALVVIGGIMYGGNCLGSSSSPPPQTQVTDKKAPGATPPQDELASFISFVLDDVQQTFAREIPNYKESRLTLFRGSVKSACGTATSAVGPFYCPNDHKAYVDLAFYDQLRKQFGAPGDFAQAYVIAHEIGHHVQNLRGNLGGGETSSVATELQADCLAGSWAKDAQRRNLLEVGDIDEALNAASQIGDDTLQKKSQGYVQPETFTHGSAAQRSGAFKKGFEGGIAACN